MKVNALRLAMWLGALLVPAALVKLDADPTLVGGLAPMIALLIRQLDKQYLEPALAETHSVTPVVPADVAVDPVEPVAAPALPAAPDADAPVPADVATDPVEPVEPVVEGS